MGNEINTATISLDRLRELEAYEKAVKERKTVRVDNIIYEGEEIGLAGELIKANQRLSDSAEEWRERCMERSRKLDEAQNKIKELQKPKKKWWQI